MLKKLLMYTDFEEVYEEIEDRYKAYLMMEYNSEEINDSIGKYIDSVVVGEGTRVLCELIFATIEWKYGRLDVQKLSNLLEMIVKLPNTESYTEKQKESLVYYTKILYDPQPARKIFKKPAEFRAPWKPGDFLTIKITDNHNWSKFDFSGKYILVKVIKIMQEPTVRYDTKHSDDNTYFQLYDWIGDEPAKLEDTWNSQIVKLSSQSGLGCVMFKKKDIKTFDIRVISPLETTETYGDIGDDLMGVSLLNRVSIFSVTEAALKNVWRSRKEIRK